MVQIDRSWSLFGICICVVAALIAPFFTHPDYNWVRHTTGELAGQQMPNAWIMRVGFISLGFGVFFDALQKVAKHQREYMPFIVFGFCMIGAGTFNQRSIDTTQFFAEPLAHWHGFLFIISAIALAAGIGRHAYASEDTKVRAISFVAFVIVVSMAPVIYFLPSIAGVLERFGLGVALLWMACFFHKRTA